MSSGHASAIFEILANLPLVPSLLSNNQTIAPRLSRFFGSPLSRFMVMVDLVVTFQVGLTGWAPLTRSSLSRYVKGFSLVCFGMLAARDRMANRDIVSAAAERYILAG